MAIGTKGFLIASNKVNGEWNWRTFGTGAGFVADSIVAGTMLADRIRGGTLILGGADINANGKFQLYDKAGVLVLDSDTVTALATQAALDAKGDKTYNVNDFTYTINANELKTFTISLDKSTYKYGQALIYSYADASGLGNDNATLLQISLDFCKNSLRTLSLITPDAEKFYTNSFTEQKLKSNTLSSLGYLSLQGGLDYANRWTTGTVLIDFYLDDDKIKFTVLNQTGASVTGAMRVQSQVW